MKVRPMGMLLMMLVGWINRHQQDVITYLKEENKTLREKLGPGILGNPMSLVQDGSDIGTGFERVRPLGRESPSRVFAGSGSAECP